MPICASGDCQIGKASVEQMGKTFNVLLQNPNFNRGNFEQQVTAIEQTFEDTYAFYSPYIPFNPTCCAVLEIGKQADGVTAAMLRSVGLSTLPGPSQIQTGAGSDSWITLAIVAGVAIIAGNVAPLIRKR